MSLCGSVSSHFTMPSAIKSAAKKFFKKSTRSSASDNESQTTHSSGVSDVHSRRAEALRSCGLLQQSRIYGRAPYQDEDDESEDSYGAGSAYERDLIDFDVDYESKDRRDTKYRYGQKSMSEETYSPTSSSHYSSPAPMYSPPSSDCSSTFSDRQTRPQQFNIRRRASLFSDIERIEDAESRRLTEVAFLC